MKDWAAIAPGQTRDSFQGDAVVSNDKLRFVLRKEDGAVRVITHQHGASGLELRLQGPGGDAAVRLERVALVENTRTTACVEASFRTAKGSLAATKFRIKRGDISVQVEPGQGADRLRTECMSRYLVLPDFFADDIVLDARRLPLGEVELPSENFVLHLLESRHTIAMCVFENRQQDVKATLHGEGDRRVVTGSEIGFEGKKVWVALLEGPDIWHEHDVQSADAGKILPLGWKMPFPAQYRVDFTRPDLLTDSWEMLLQEQKNGPYIKPSWLGGGDQTLGQRMRWNTVLGTFPYPCWSDSDRQGYLQPLQGKAVQFQGPALVYPINRVQQTPLDAYTVVDVMRNTLGVGPCQHILDLEGQKSEYKGRATCSVRDELTPIYQRHEQKAKRANVNRFLDEGLTFVNHIRSRITRYVEFGQKMRQYLAEQRQAHPELREFLDEMDRLTGEIDRRVAARVGKIKTPDHVAQMNEEFRKNVLDYEGPDSLDRCQQYTKALVEIGDNQDELSGECRWAAKTLRQRAGIWMALDPRVTAVASEIRTRTQEVLRNPASHESARH
jgi:hypothetical protein